MSSWYLAAKAAHEAEQAEARSAVVEALEQSFGQRRCVDCGILHFVGPRCPSHICPPIDGVRVSPLEPWASLPLAPQ